MIDRNKLKEWTEERLMFEYNDRMNSLAQAKKAEADADAAWERGAQMVQSLGRRDMSPYMKKDRERQYERCQEVEDRVRKIEDELKQIRSELDNQ